MQNIKYLLMSTLLFNSLLVFSMKEEIIDMSDVNENTKLLASKPKEKKISENLNKISIKEFVNILPKDIWKEILSYLKYEDNRKAILQFLAINFDIDDFTAKKIAIEIYRFAILNSTSLSNYNKIRKNIFKHWKNVDNIKLVENYLTIINDLFLKSNKSFNKDSELLDEEFSSIFSSLNILSKNETVLFILYYKIHQLNDLAKFSSSSRNQINLGWCQFNQENSVNPLKIKVTYATISTVICLISIVAVVIFILINPLKGNKNPGILSAFPFIVCCFCVLPSFVLCAVISDNICRNNSKAIKIRNKFNFFNKLNKEITKFLQNNNLCLSDTDDYFLKILGHESKVEDISDLEIV